MVGQVMLMAAVKWSIPVIVLMVILFIGEPDIHDGIVAWINGSAPK